MADEAVKFGLTRRRSRLAAGAEKKIHGVTVAHGHQQHRQHRRGRVQLMLPVAAGLRAVGALSTPMAGMLRGTFFVPQIGDEVLVAFNQGDVREPFVVGALWNTIDRAAGAARRPTPSPSARSARRSATSSSFDEALQSVTLTSNTLSDASRSIR